jgi:hypothetical protein
MKLTAEGDRYHVPLSTPLSTPYLPPYLPQGKFRPYPELAENATRAIPRHDSAPLVRSTNNAHARRRFVGVLQILFCPTRWDRMSGVC